VSVPPQQCEEENKNKKNNKAGCGRAGVDFEANDQQRQHRISCRSIVREQPPEIGCEPIGGGFEVGYDASTFKVSVMEVLRTRW
jgi:hypothetical protein